MAWVSASCHFLSNPSLTLQTTGDLLIPRSVNSRSKTEIHKVLLPVSCLLNIALKYSDSTLCKWFCTSSSDDSSSIPGSHTMGRLTCLHKFSSDLHMWAVTLAPYPQNTFFCLFVFQNLVIFDQRTSKNVVIQSHMVLCCLQSMCWLFIVNSCVWLNPYL